MAVDVSEGLPPRVECVWLDATMSDPARGSHWHDGMPDAPNPIACSTVGYLTHVTPVLIKIVQTLTTDQHGNWVEIPVGMVQRITLLADSDAPVPGMPVKRTRKRKVT
jgi:hypothetical protein